MKKLLFVLTLAWTPLAGFSQEKAPLKVAIFLYEGAELLDFAGPGEVFANAPGFEVYTVAETTQPLVTMHRAFAMTPNYSIENCPAPDILVLPGAGAGPLMKVYNNDKLIAWIKSVSKNTKLTMSVCTGAAFLSKTGLLDGRTVTTHWGAVSNLQKFTPKAVVKGHTRFVEDGRILTTAGVSAGLDGALHVVEKYRGRAEAERVARLIEYDKWQPAAGLVVAHK